MLIAIAEIASRAPPRFRLPRAPLFPLAFAAEMAARLTGKKPFLTRDALRMASHRMFFSAARAQCELGYRARPWRIALEDAIAWYRSAGYFR